MHKITATIAYLKRCRAARAAGYPVSLTTDPEWLVDMAINRRAGWPDDSGFARGSAMPVRGKYPKRAEGDGEYGHAERIAARVNAPRLRVHRGELGSLRKRLLPRIPDRFCDCCR